MLQSPKEETFQQWKQYVEATAQFHEIGWTLPQIIVSPQGITPSVQATVLLNVVSSIRMKCSKDIEKRMNAEVWTKKPHEVLKEKERFMLHQSDMLQNNLRTEAEMTKVSSKKVEEDFKNHMEMRNKMVNGLVPGKENERMTINYLVN